jgi:hypothetical protein
MMTANYKQLAEELCKTLEEVIDIIKKFEVPPVLDYKMTDIENALPKYEQETTRRTGRTTALYIKCIAEALENPGKSVEFIDHYPHTWGGVSFHIERLEKIINKLGYDIVVSTKGQPQVFLYNRFVAGHLKNCHRCP